LVLGLTERERRGDVQDVRAAGHRLAPAGVVGEVGGDDLERAVADQVAHLLLPGERPHRRAHAMAVLVQPPDAVGADEPGAAGDEDEAGGHGQNLIHLRRLVAWRTTITPWPSSSAARWTCRPGSRSGGSGCRGTG